MISIYFFNIFAISYFKMKSVYYNFKFYQKFFYKPQVTKTTKVQPFHFAESKKRKRETEETESHIPLAEQVAAFQKKTPQRFHTTGPKSEFIFNRLLTKEIMQFICIFLHAFF